MRYQWPGDARCAVVLSFDVDAEAPVLFRNPEAARDRLGLMEEHRYGPRVGLGRILALLEKRSLPASFFVPAWTLQTYPDAIREVMHRGYELGCHGDVHEALAGMSEEDERATLVRQLDRFDSILGMRPQGYRSPSWDLNVRTPELLREFGFMYDSSLMGNDIPYDLGTPGGPLMEVPVQWLLDDAPFYRHVYGSPNQIAEPERVIRLWSREFRAMYEENGCFVLTMHPFLTGRPGRIDALNELLDYIDSFEGVWFTTTLEVAEWAIRNRPQASERQRHPRTD